VRKTLTTTTGRKHQDIPAQVKIETTDQKGEAYFNDVRESLKKIREAFLEDRGKSTRREGGALWIERKGEKTNFICRGKAESQGDEDITRKGKRAESDCDLSEGKGRWYKRGMSGIKSKRSRDLFLNF